MMVNEMDEVCLLAFQTREAIQNLHKEWYDHHLKNRKKSFKKGDLVLLYDTQCCKHLNKLKMHWMGPYWLVQVFDNVLV